MELNFKNHIFKARQRSCGKVMFIQVTIIQFRGGVVSQVTGPTSSPGHHEMSVAEGVSRVRSWVPCLGVPPSQGSHSTWKTWKTWKNESTPGKRGNIMEF